MWSESTAMLKTKRFPKTLSLPKNRSQDSRLFTLTWILCRFLPRSCCCTHKDSLFHYSKNSEIPRKSTDGILKYWRQSIIKLLPNQSKGLTYKNFFFFFVNHLIFNSSRLLWNDTKFQDTINKIFEPVFTRVSSWLRTEFLKLASGARVIDKPGRLGCVLGVFLKISYRGLKKTNTHLSTTKEKKKKQVITQSHPHALDATCVCVWERERTSPSGD